MENTAGFCLQYLVRHSHDFAYHFIQLVLFHWLPPEAKHRSMIHRNFALIHASQRHVSGNCCSPIYSSAAYLHTISGIRPSFLKRSDAWCSYRRRCKSNLIRFSESHGILTMTRMCLTIPPHSLTNRFLRLTSALLHRPENPFAFQP